jgi:hypothetical protein
MRWDRVGSLGTRAILHGAEEMQMKRPAASSSACQPQLPNVDCHESLYMQRHDRYRTARSDEREDARSWSTQSIAPVEIVMTSPGLATSPSHRETHDTPSNSTACMCVTTIYLVFQLCQGSLAATLMDQARRQSAHPAQQQLLISADTCSMRLEQVAYPHSFSPPFVHRHRIGELPCGRGMPCAAIEPSRVLDDAGREDVNSPGCRS